MDRRNVARLATGNKPQPGHGEWSDLPYAALRRVARGTFRRGLALANDSLGWIEERIVPDDDRFSYPPVFIIGAPRSGSTLLYQVLVNAFRFGYFTNLHCALYKAPYTVQRYLAWATPKSRPVAYESTHGKTRGLLGPSECGEFWYRWFRRRPQYVPLSEVALPDFRSLRKTLIGLVRAFNAPLLIKNMPCALRLQPLGKLFPEAVFLVVRRHPLWNAQSLLAVREQVFGDYGTWWSMEPLDIEKLLALPVEGQVVRQLMAIDRVIRDDSQAIGSERFYSVSYEALCADVPSTLEGIHRFLARQGTKVEPLHSVPQAFEVSNRVTLPPERFRSLERHINEVFSADARGV